MRKLRFTHGVLLFAGLMVSLIVIGTPMQSYLGMLGVALTEIMIALFAIVPALAFRQDLRGMFPLRWPKFRQIIGVGLLWLSSYMGVALVTLLLTYFFPEQMTQVNSSLQSVFTSVPLPLALLVIAVMPAICEELFHRGLLWYTASSLKPRWLVVLVMGLIFGVFHLDGLRFFPTGILGMVLTFIMLETDNLVLPMLFHLLNNAVSTYASFQSDVTQTAVAVSKTLIIQSIGSIMIICTLMPWIFTFGVKLILPSDKKRRVPWWIPAICSAALLLGGAGLIVSAMNREPLNETNMAFAVDSGNELAFQFDVEDHGVYQLELETSITKGVMEVKIIDQNNETKFQIYASSFTGTNSIELDQGTYTVLLRCYVSEEELKEYFASQNMEFTDDAKFFLNLEDTSLAKVEFRFKIY